MSVSIQTKPDPQMPLKMLRFPGSSVRTARLLHTLGQASLPMFLSWPSHCSLTTQGTVGCGVRGAFLADASISVPTVSMRAWIRTRLYRFVSYLNALRWRFRDDGENVPTTEDMKEIWRAVYEDERVRVSQYTKSCGHPGYLIEHDVYLPDTCEWLTNATFGGDSFESSMIMLAGAIDFLRSRRECDTEPPE